MPNYEYACDKQHVFDLVRPLGTEGVLCPSCGRAAVRTHRPFSCDVIGPTVDTRGQFRRFQDVSNDIDHKYTQAEARVGESLTRPNIYNQAKAKAQAIMAAGEAPKLRSLDQV